MDGQHDAIRRVRCALRGRRRLEPNANAGAFSTRSSSALTRLQPASHECRLFVGAEAGMNASTVCTKREYLGSLHVRITPNTDRSTNRARHYSSVPRTDLSTCSIQRLSQSLSHNE